jgi:hypothetical protein
VTVFTKSSLPANAPNDGSVTFNVNVDLQQDVTCTFTNKHKPRLSFDKIVVNNYGGTAVDSDFTFHTTGNNIMKWSDGSPLTSASNLKDGDSVVMDGGSNYNVTEDNFYGYKSASTQNCSGTFNFNDEVTCVITNDDIQPKLKVVKHVINDNGGSAVASDFTMTVTGTNVAPSTSFLDQRRPAADSQSGRLLGHGVGTDHGLPAELVELLWHDPCRR